MLSRLGQFCGHWEGAGLLEGLVECAISRVMICKNVFITNQNRAPLHVFCKAPFFIGLDSRFTLVFSGKTIPSSCTVVSNHPLSPIPNPVPSEIVQIIS